MRPGYCRSQKRECADPPRAEVQHHRTAGLLICVLRDASAVVAHGRSHPKASRREPCQRSTPAVSHHAYVLVPNLGRRTLHGGSHVPQRILHPDLTRDRESALHIFRRISQLDSALNTIEQRRRDRQVAVVRKTVHHRANVMVHAKNLLDHNHGPDHALTWPRDVRSQFVSVVRL